MKQLQVVETCDVCLISEEHSVPAATSTQISIDGVTVEVECCNEHSKILNSFSEWLSLYAHDPLAAPRQARQTPIKRPRRGRVDVPCEFCDSVPSSWGGLAQHLRNHHPEYWAIQTGPLAIPCLQGDCADKRVVFDSLRSFGWHMGYSHPDVLFEATKDSGDKTMSTLQYLSQLNGTWRVERYAAE